MRIHFVFLYSLLLLVIPLKAQLGNQEEGYTDGPYLILKDQQVRALWMENNLLKVKQFTYGQPIDLPANISPDFQIHFEDVESLPVPQEQIHFQTTGPIAALSDIHGQYNVTVKLLREHHIIDQQNNWIFGNGQLVIVGDVFDRGDQVTELLWLIHKLEKQAPKSRGRVHLLLGNHELMVLTGDLRFLHPKYRYMMALTKRPYNELFSPDTYLGSWLRSKPFAITINDIAFVHGGFSELLLEKVDDLKAINQLGRQSLYTQPGEVAKDPLLNFMASMDGPLWYRGYFDEKEMTRKSVDNILQKLQVNHIVVGHTSHESITPLFNNRIIGVDSSIKFGKTGEILILDHDVFYRGTIFGERIKL